MAHPLTNPYLVNPLVKTQAVFRLFCFPYAGGSARIFQKWPHRFPPTVEVCPLQYPGRGNRLREQPFARLEPLVQNIAEALLPLLEKPFAFFGHSMGAMVAFELTRQLRRENKTLPVQLLVSASRAPQLPDRTPVAYDLPEPEFIQELRRLNGTPTEVLDHPELMKLMLPLLRADFAVAQTYTYIPEPPLLCPIRVYGGLEDQSVLPESLEGWREQTTGPFSLRLFPGDHFFLQTAESLLIQRITEELSQSMDFWNASSA
jgi:medium-chain acyl-[acyl-carrier-protein] hydrolase